jgi:galactose mutarotase-like enzyme
MRFSTGLLTTDKLTRGAAAHCATIHEDHIFRGNRRMMAAAFARGKVKVSDQSDSWITLSSGELSAQINPLGAQLSVLRDRAGRDLLWDGNPAFWNGRAPVLFPIVGNLAGGSYRLGSKTYHLPRHGFARNRPFTLVNAGSDSALLRLQADEASLQVYPFQFELDVSFALRGATLTVTMTARNLGREDMPASFGYHPAFRWPLPYDQPREAHYLEFAADQPDTIRRLDSGGLLEERGFPTPVVNRRLLLKDELFQDDVVIFDRIQGHSVSHGAQRGPRLRVSYPDATYLGVWTKPGAPFICIEPWQGIADPAGFGGDFTSKPGVFNVLPGGAQSITMEIALLEG